MATLTASGLGSNLDVEGLVTQLMSVERKPITALDKPAASYQAKLTAFGSLKSSLASFQTALSGLTSPAGFNIFAASVTDSSVLQATPGTSANAGKYSVEVKTLAQAQKISTDPATSAFASANATVGTGTLTIQLGTNNSGVFTANGNTAAKNITIDSSNNTLTGIRNAINAANAGVTASVINDGGTYRLVIGANDTGTTNSLKISVSDSDGNSADTSGLSALAYDPAGSTGSGKSMKQTLAASDATLTIDGIDVTSASNTVKNAIDGVTLNLTKTNLGSPTTLAITRNSAGIRTAIENLVKAYNNTTTTLKNLSSYDATTQKAGELLGDATLGSVQRQLRSILNTPLASAGGGLSSLSDIGVSFLKTGMLSIDFTKLESVVNDPTKDISTLFASVGKSTDSQVGFSAATANTKSGSYAVNVTQAATQSKLSGSNTNGSTIIDTANNSFGLSVDGVSTTVSLTSGTYTPASLAAEVQSKINGATALASAGIAVTVTAGTSGVLTGGSAAATTIDSSNNQLDVTLGGVTRTITLTNSTDRVAGGAPDYSAATLATELQTQINAAFASDNKTVAVNQNSGVFSLTLNNSFGSAQNVSLADAGGTTGASSLFGAAPVFTAGTEMAITSNRYGAKSAISFTASSATTNLFGAETIGTVAKDVAGTIGGVTATGFGQTLTAETGDAKGLKITIAGSNTGDRGAINFALGYASQLDQALSRILSSDGLITSRTGGINASITSLNTRRTALEARMTKIETRYRAQFTSLDLLLSKMTQTSSYLTQQLASLSSLNA